MKLSSIKKLFGGKPRPESRLVAITSERTGERTLLGVENLLSSIAVPEPFSLEIAGGDAGVTLLARCREGSFVKQQLGAHYPQARVNEVSPEDDPLRLAEGEQAWSMNLRLKGPEVPAPAHFQGRRPAGPGFRSPDLRHRRHVRPAGWRKIGGPVEAALPGAGVGPPPPGEGGTPAAARPGLLPPEHPGPD